MKNKKPFKKWFFSGFWPYWLGAVIIGILNILLTIVYKPWGVTANLTNIGLRIWAKLGGNPAQSLPYYFQYAGQDFFSNNIFYTEATVLNVGIIFGALLSGLLASEFRFKKIKSRNQLLKAIIGGLLMGYGTRLSLGCNVGALLSGIASQSLHGWIFAFFSFAGALAGCFIIITFMKKYN